MTFLSNFACCCWLNYFLSFTWFLLIMLYFPFQEVHAPILSIWGVKMVVIAIFVAFALASIVSLWICFYSYKSFQTIPLWILTHYFLSSLLSLSILFSSKPHRLWALELNLDWSRRLLFPETHIFRLDILACIMYSCFLLSMCNVCLQTK
jgi:RsiW-degrading membrane proteinase PrsW (M82 family)